MNCALLIIDVQKDYFPNGRMELAGSVETAKRIEQVIGKARTANMPIIYIQHIASKKDASFFIDGTDGIDIYAEIKPSQDDIIFVKHYPNSFKATGLDEHCKSKGIDSLIIVGMMTHMCVDTTTRAACDLGYACTLIGDCCATKDLQFDGRLVQAKDVQAAYLAALDKTFANVIRTEHFLNMEIN